MSGFIMPLAGGARGSDRPAWWFLMAGLLSLTPSGGVQAVQSAEVRDDRSAALQQLVDRTRERLGTLGLSLGVVTADGEVIGVASGHVDRARREPLEASGRMLSGSVGKTYFAALAMQLVNEGVLGLDDPVRHHLGHLDWYATVPNGESVTVRHLLTHTSGLNRYVMNSEFQGYLGTDPMRSYTTPERIAFAGPEPLFPAGEGWAYADTNFILLAEVLEVATGREAYALIGDRFLGPMGLEETTPSNSPSVPGLVPGFAGPNNAFGGFDETLRDGRMVVNPQFEWGGGGYASSARDLARWIRAVQTGEAFPPVLLSEARSSAVPAPLAPQGRYGLGMIGMTVSGLGDAWGHSGFMPGYMTEAYHFVDSQVTIVLMINASDPSESGGPLLRTLLAIAPEVVALTN